MSSQPIKEILRGKSTNVGGCEILVDIWIGFATMVPRTFPMLPPSHHCLTGGGENMEYDKPQKAEVKRLVDLMDYQEQSVVSRTIIDKKTGTVTLFAFDQTQGLSEHTAPFDALIYLLDGKAEITISGETFHLKQGEMIIMPANKPHAVKAIEKFKMILTMIRS
jgi:quercetin dioxygenase-like cupin family protein